MERSENTMPYRTLGRTGEKVSLIGLEGFHIGKPDLSDEESIRIIRTAIDRGVNFMDNSWDYHEGTSERRMGLALRDGYRDKVFLMSKFDGRDRRSAAKQIDESLERLGTDRIDLLQFHEIIYSEDPDSIFAEGGAVEAALEARDDGKVRYLGFTGHKSPDIHLKMLDAGERHGFRFDTVQLPLNVMDPHFESFEKNVLPRLVREEMGVIGMKPMGGGHILESGTTTATECLHYVMNLPTSVVVTGCDSMALLEQALKAARSFQPMTSEEREAILTRTERVAKEGRHELYKTTRTFDSTYHHPQWLGKERLRQVSEAQG